MIKKGENKKTPVEQRPADRKIERGFYVEMYYEKSPKFLMEREIRTFAKKMNLPLSTTV